MTVARNAALAAALIVLAASPMSYAFATAALTAIVIALVASWRDERSPAPAPVTRRSAGVIVALAAAALIVVAAFRWIDVMAWLPYHADMLIVIREATKRFLGGHDPYFTYRSYDTGWEMAMPYGPALWGPYLVAQFLHADLRFVTIAGELFVPVWLGVAAAIAAARGRIGAALSWILLLAAVLLALDVQRFTLIGHTPSYWPWLVLFAVAVAADRWIAGACLIAVLVAARTTMVALVPVFLIAVWRADRRRLVPAMIAGAVTGAALLGPFAIWDARTLWSEMVLSYPRVMKAAVWPVLARPGLETIGVTESLIEHHLEALVVPVQIAAMVVVYAAAWIALSRGRRSLPWMALALFAFSLTTLYPVHYLYYDVLLLLACAALADTLAVMPMRRLVAGWIGSAAAIALALGVVLRASVAPFPRIAIGDPVSPRALRAGFGSIEHDGRRGFAWAIGGEARLAVPRSSDAPADIVIAGESPFGEGQAPQRVTAILNGTVLGDTAIAPGHRDIRIRVATSAWWIGFNDLQLTFASTQAPHDAGGSADTRPLALAIDRIDVVPR